MNLFANGAVSNHNSQLTYQFDFGDGTQSTWGTSSCIHTYSSTGKYTVKVKARSQKNSSVESSWSNTIEISVTNPETITKPGVPYVTETVKVNQQFTINSSGASSSAGSALEYQYNWGNGYYSSWGGKSINYTYSYSGTYNIYIRARSKINSEIVGEWSDPLQLTVTEPSMISVSLNTLTFGNIKVNDVSPFQTYNVSGANLTSDISISAPAGFQVSLSNSSEFSNSLNIQQSGGIVPQTNVYVRFNPTDVIKYTGNISNSSVGAKTKNVSVSGLGEKQSKLLLFDPDVNFNFGNVMLNNTSNKIVTISNNGSAVVHVSKLQLSENTQFYLISNSGNSFDIPVGEKVELTVRFKPTSEGEKSTMLTISNDSENAPAKVINFSGTSEVVIPSETVFIPAGTFTMGSPDTEVSRDDDETQHTVTLSAFRISKYEITNAQYATFLNAKSIGSDGIYYAGTYPNQVLIYASSGSYDWGLHYTNNQWIPVAGYENYPVIFVTWYGATEYATYAGGTLPTEAQWEYACRAGTTTPFNTGNCLTNLQTNYDWDYPYSTCSNNNTTEPGKTQPVGSYAPNALGLYDMHGNVWEWCADWYGTYPTAAQTNPPGPAGSRRVLRGGSWYSDARYCRSSNRGSENPSYYYDDFGFRVVFVPTSVDNRYFNNVKIFPNPVKNVINFELENNSRSKVHIYNSLGKEILTREIDLINKTMNVESLSRGLYLMKLTDESGDIVYTGKFIKQ